MSADLRHTILGADDVKVQPFPAPEWGLKEGLFVRVISGTERDALEGRFQIVDGHKNLDNFRAWWAGTVLCNEKGARVFTDKDIDELGKKSWAVLDRAMDAGMALNGFGDEDIAELVKNSESGQSDDSGSS